MLTKNVMILSKSSLAVHENHRLDEALTALGLKAQIRHPDRFALTMGANPVLTYAGEKLQRPDLVLSRTGSGTGSHATTVVRQLEAMGVPVVNSLSAIEAAMDKVHTMQVAASASLPIPRTLIYSPQKSVLPDWELYPCIVKLATGSRGNGVIRCEGPTELKALIGMMWALNPKRPFLIQEYIADRPGSDLRVLIVGGKAVGAMLRQSEDGDFRANISAGGRGANFALTSEIVHISETISRLLGLEIAGVDLLFSGDKFVLCEANSAPGFRGFEEYCDPKIADKMAEFVKNRLNSPPLLLAS
jgi:gamma-F420-2:alpha-L-glutamate ligase